MFERFRSFWAKLKRVITPSGAIEREFKVAPAVSRAMEQNIGLWYAMYVNQPPWETCDVWSLGLPGAVAREFTRAALTEFSVTVSGSPRADYIHEQMERAALTAIPNALELGLALGGVALKPCLEGDSLIVDFTGATAFTPTAFDGAGRAVSGVFRDVAKVGDKRYARLEYHGFEWSGGDQLYVIRNAAYVCGSDGMPGGEKVDLDTVPQWAELPEEIFLSGIERPLFAYFKRPTENNVDFGSNVGTSIYGGAAVNLIRQADEQWGRLMWEYESGERKVFVDGVASNAKQFKNSRLFEFGPFGGPEGGLFEIFNPEMRDDSLYNGFQRILQRIEFETGLAFGDISDPQSVEKTATEIRSGKHRKYVTVGAIQKALRDALDGLIYAMNAYCDIYQVTPAGNYEVAYTWGDSVLDDPEARRQDKAVDMQEVTAGLMNDFEYRMKWYGESEEEAKANLPGMETLTTEPQEEIE